MGSFFLVKNNKDIDLKNIINSYAERGFDNPFIKTFNNYTLYLYKKQRIQHLNYFETNNSGVYCVGSPIYKGNPYSLGLRQILNDFVHNKLSLKEFAGIFFILLSNNGNLFFLLDQAGIQNLYFDKWKNILSSSFLSIIYGLNQEISFNKNACIEVLTTGSLIGPDTLFNEIRKFEITHKPKFIKLTNLNVREDILKFSSLSNVSADINFQIGLLENYFRVLNKFIGGDLVDSGITGGFDSRLLLILAKKYLSNIKFYSHWRPVASLEYNIAQEICEHADIEFHSIPVKHPLEMQENEAWETLESSYYFYDGHVRSHIYWTESYNTKTYREKLLGSCQLGLSGIGGEQYRNHERMILPYWNLNNWIKYDLILRQSGNSFMNNEALESFVSYLKKKITRGLDIENDYWINHLNVKRYFNEIFIPANRSVRTNIENQLTFFLSPFAEYEISRNAYRIIDHLGPALNFQAKMIKILDSDLAKIKSDYGFNFFRGETFQQKIFSYLKEYTPSTIFYHFITKRRMKTDELYINYNKRFNFCPSLINNVKELNLPVNLDVLGSSPTVAPLIICLGFFIEKLGNKISKEKTC